MATGKAPKAKAKAKVPLTMTSRPCVKGPTAEIGWPALQVQQQEADGKWERPMTELWHVFCQVAQPEAVHALVLFDAVLELSCEIFLYSLLVRK